MFFVVISLFELQGSVLRLAPNSTITFGNNVKIVGSAGSGLRDFGFGLVLFVFLVQFQRARSRRPDLS